MCGVANKEGCKSIFVQKGNKKSLYKVRYLLQYKLHFITFHNNSAIIQSIHENKVSTETTKIYKLLKVQSDRYIHIHNTFICTYVRMKLPTTSVDIILNTKLFK